MIRGRNRRGAGLDSGVVHVVTDGDGDGVRDGERRE